jgi:hypothetical protein
MTTPHDITDDIPLDISVFTAPTTFALTDTAYDITIDDIPFVASVSNQNPYRRETAQYRKDQFDNSQEPGEQSLTGWWLRSQTSWHNGAGISFYEPGTDYQHVSHRFFDSRGIDVWTIGEAKLLNDVFHSYTGANGIIAVAGESVGGTDYIVSGDSAGILKKLTLNGDAAASTANYTLATGHNAAGQPINPFKAITSDGTRYFAVCDKAIHAGNIDGTGTDVVVARHATGGLHSIKYVKGYLMFGEAEKLYYIPVANPLVDEGHGGSAEKFPTGTVFKRHINPNFVWNTIEGGDRFIYAGGYAGSDSEIWAVPFDPDSATLAPDPASAIQVIQLPYGETINAMQYYLGYMAIGTSKGIRIAQSNNDGSLTLGPLLVETEFPVTGFTATGNYVFASTSVMGTYTNPTTNVTTDVSNAILIRIDLSQQFSDGTFAYAYDLQYESDEDSYASDVLFAEDRLHIIVNEGGDAGEIQTEKLSQKRASGWLQTGKIRYGTVEPKFFRYINVQCDTGQGDSIVAYTINDQGNQASIATLSAGLSNQDVFIGTLSAAQELVSFKFVFNNVTDDAGVPVLNAYQIKALPAAKRQRLIQYPLSCFDHEMDKFNSIFGYEGRAISTIQRLEAIEQTGRFVNITDYRTGEQYQGIIEEVRFTNESSPDKNGSGFGGLLLVTVRKL